MVSLAKYLRWTKSLSAVKMMESPRGPHPPSPWLTSLSRWAS